jgi:acetyl esterase/lipase
MHIKRVKGKLLLLLLISLLLSLGGCAEKKSNGSYWVGKVLVESDISFFKSSDFTLRLDMASPKGTGPFPALVYMFGSGWGHWGASKSLYYLNIIQAAQKGYVAVAIDYRQTSTKENGLSKYRYPAQIHDAKAAVRWLRANYRKYNIDPDRIGAVGFSSGGHLSLLLAFTSPEDGLEGDIKGSILSSGIQAVVSSAGPTDLRKSFSNPESKAAIEELIGGSLTEFPDMYAMASPVTFVKADSPPVLLIHGSDDNEVPFEQAIVLNRILQEKGVVHELITRKGAGHQDFTMEPEVLDFIDKHLKKNSQ